MTDFTDEQLEAVREAIDATARENHGSAAAWRESCIARLRPALRFRKGEIVAHEFIEDDQPTTEYVAFDAIGGWDGCRRLRLSEMPQAVEDLRKRFDWYAEADHIPEFVRRQAQTDREDFDREIEP